MKKALISLTLALAAVLLVSDTASARRWAYVKTAPGRVRVVPRVAYRPIYPVLMPTTTVPITTTYVAPTNTYIAPTVVVGPRGRLHYAAPIQPIVVGPYYAW